MLRSRNMLSRPATVMMYFHVAVLIVLFQISRCDLVKLTLVSNGTDVIGEDVALSCRTNDTSVRTLKWWWNDSFRASETTDDSSFHEAVLFLRNVSLNNFGRYICQANLSSGEVTNSSLNLQFNVETTVSVAPTHVVNEGKSVKMACTVTGFPSPSSIHWSFVNRQGYLSNSSDYQISILRRSPGEIFSSLNILNASPEMNGTYSCLTPDGDNDTQLIVKSKPIVRFLLVKAVGKSKIYVNWTLFDGNSKILKLSLQYFQDKKSTPNTLELKPTDSSVLLKNLTSRQSYFNFSIIAVNEVGRSSDIWEQSATTLFDDPHFVPDVLVKGFTSNTVTLGWNVLSNVTEYYNFYNVTVRTRGGNQQTYLAYENPFMVEKLNPGADYHFRVQACSSFTRSCDAISSEVNGTTMDGMSGPPRNLNIQCKFDHSTHESTVHVTWDDPQDPHGQIIEYDVVLTGNSSYYDENGRQAEDKIGPIPKTVLARMPRKAEFSNQSPNTQLFISICAKTRTRTCGATTEATCSTPESIPDSEKLNKAIWKAVQRGESQQIFFMVTLPHISQRNGTICCLRVIVVRLLKDQTIEDLKPPREMEILTYDIVHNGTNYGAYVAEMLDANSRNIMIGDGVVNERQFCHKCWSQDDILGAGGFSYRPPEHYPVFNSIGPHQHRKRHTNSNSVPLTIAQDGPLDTGSTYTAYIDAIVLNDKHQRMRAQSKYFPPLRPVKVEAHESMVPGVAIVGSLIVALIVVLVALMCVMRWRRKEPGEQEYGLSHSIQQWCRRLRGQQRIPSEEPPNLPALSKDELVSAYLDRHKDSDLGFQQEFERLPDRFCDRTSHASDHRDNSGKNRYPDIKAYDQTRIKLSTSENGSDYINANIVVGYKERKKFVCAQGPMESTVVDWWRMIWEQHVHFILMLTNVEEYNKTKCAKYWPNEGSTNYADFMVTHCSEKRYSDYLVRNLKLSKIRSGPGNVEEGIKEEREILQYHYLVWKDFMAPEHPVGILRFIKRFNEIYAPDKGPILVHCSAGVGRTGTLVALDSLLQQLNEETCVAIFNTICDLRHQRNYLVQSLKQYIFIYRALMEMAQFGDTDVSVSELKSHIEKLKGVPEGKTISRMQEEYERLVQVIEDRKPFTVGASDENRHRNRHENVIPYDRSRVHLSPMPGLNKEINTYINASFIEGYDNTEQFIIAQDPLDVTIGDFWRLMVEQNIRSIVMLSETGDEKCPRYWPEKDQETSHDYIKVKYMQSQSFPFYYRREFTVTDTKTDHSCLVTQFQYNGWPVGEGEVPQIDRGIVELIDTTFKYKETLEGNVGPMVVHCSDGADRSCIFVALAILVQQMMNESRVDVFSAVRKLRSQRQGLFRNFAQYEFIYRGLYTYAELHVANGNAGH